jgi:ribosome biogenesis protein MAK21
MLHKESTITKKLSIYLELVLRSIKSDTNISRKKALVKRLMQTCFYANQNYVCAVLIILNELFILNPYLKTLLTEKESFLNNINFNQNDDDENEIFYDVVKDNDDDKNDNNNNDDDDENNKDDDDENDEDNNDEENNDKENNEENNDEKNEKIEFKISNEKEEEKEEKKKIFYDLSNPRATESGAENTNLWELNLLFNSYHPSISKFAELILKNQKNLNFIGDPLVEFTLLKFLDKFNYKKPKKPKNFQNKEIKNTYETPLPNTEEFLNIPKKLIKEDEKFYIKVMEERKRKRDESNNEEEEDKTLKATKVVKKMIDDSNRYEYNYDDIGQALEDDQFDEEYLDNVLLSITDFQDENESESIKKSFKNDGENKKKSKKQKKEDEEFAYDVTDGDINDNALANQDEVDDLFHDEDNENDKKKNVSKKFPKNPKKFKSKK